MTKATDGKDTETPLVSLGHSELPWDESCVISLKAHDCAGERTLKQSEDSPGRRESKENVG